jgi:predicted nucleic acid-binding protein
MTRELAVPVSEAEAMVFQLSTLPVVAIDASLVAAAVAGSREWQVSILDALILRAAEVAGCRRLLSEDLADRATYGSVVVENPFARAR